MAYSEIKLRRGNTSQHSIFTGALAEITVDTDKKVVVVHDGSTVGGTPLAKESHTHSYASITGTPTLATVATSGLFADLLSKPTTLSGYGITDALSTSGGTISGQLVLQDKLTLKTVVESAVTANSGTSYNFDLSLGSVWNITLTGNVTFTISNVPTGGVVSFNVKLTQDATGGRTVTWPASVKWPAATAPTITSTANKTDIISFTTYDSGTNWFGFVGGQNF